MQEEPPFIDGEPQEPVGVQNLGGIATGLNKATLNHNMNLQSFHPSIFGGGTLVRVFAPPLPARIYSIMFSAVINYNNVALPADVGGTAPTVYWISKIDVPPGDSGNLVTPILPTTAQFYDGAARVYASIMCNPGMVISDRIIIQFHHDSPDVLFNGQGIGLFLGLGVPTGAAMADPGIQHVIMGNASMTIEYSIT